MKTPSAPDPVATAQAQSGINLDTARTQNLLNYTNQEGPWGSTTYTPTGENSFVDSTGKTVTVPQFTQTTTYNPAQQAIFDKTTQAQTNIADIASQQSASLKDYLNTGFSFNNQDAANWAYDLGQQRIAPQQAQDRAALETQLTNKGIRPGSAAWNAELERLGQTQNDQNNQLALTGRSQAFNEALQTRNQPINEITALLSGSQIAGPNSGFSAAPQSSVAGVDYTGLVNNNYNQQVASSGGALGGLFGLAGTLGSAAIKSGAFSDARLKRDIRRIGTLPNGLPWYSFRYLWDSVADTVRYGVMSADVRKILPRAVAVHPSGFDMVDYAQVLA